MTRDDYLLELQKRVARATGWIDLDLTTATGDLWGRRSKHERHTLVPRWSREWYAVGELVQELEAGDLRGAEGTTLMELSCRAWLTVKGVDLSDLPPVP